VQSGILTFRHVAIPAAQIWQELGRHGINAGLIHGNHTPLYMGRRGVDRAVRMSIHYHNTLAELAIAGRVLRDIVGSRRGPDKLGDRARVLIG
jgi:selenocysteine lyase/cysteine desulfurase